MYDIIVLTDARYVNPKKSNDYIANVLKEDALISEALTKLGYKVYRTNWDNPNFDWSSTQAVLFRSTWDYFDRFNEFADWLETIKTKTKLINSYELIYWNIDKHYLGDLADKGISIVPTFYITPNENTSLSDAVVKTGWTDLILKPAIAGAARHTYRINPRNVPEYEAIFKSLIVNETMLLQPFLENVIKEGEVTLVVFGGKFSHAILKKAKQGDFRVQDDFGGSVHSYKASEEEIEFAESVIAACPSIPIYARVDVIRNDKNELCVSEVECIEPELWMRNNDEAANKFAKALQRITKLKPLNQTI